MRRVRHDKTYYQILAKSNNPRLSYSDLNMENLETVRHLGYDQKLILTIEIDYHECPVVQSLSNSSTIGKPCLSY